MRILFAVDLTEPVATTRAAERFAERLGAELLVLHVESLPPEAAALPIDPLTGVGGLLPYASYDPALGPETAEARSEGFEAFLRHRFSGPVRAALRTGDPAHVIVEDAEQEGIELVILGKRHQPFFERLLLGSVATAVVKRVRVPTLILPIPAESEGSG